MIAGIVVALPDELCTLTATAIAKGGYAPVAENVLVAYSGAGEKNAQRAAELLVSQGATRLISWGCAAGLVEQLKPGDLVLADNLFDANHQKVEFDRRWYSYSKKILANHLTVHSGGLVSSNQLICTSHDKRQLHLATQALVLDMESAAIAKVAGQHKLPFLAIRAVADPVSMNLPRAVQQALNEQGDIVLSKLGWFLVMHPSEIVGLIKLGLHFSAAKKTLERVAKHLNAIRWIHPNESM